MLEEHADEVEKTLLQLREPNKNKLLKSQPSTKEVTLDVKIPAKKGFTLMIAWPPKATEVKVKMVERKGRE
jgi:hypothetical protein